MGMEHSREELHAEVERTRAAYREALARFREIIYDAPSGVPYPDGVARVSRAGQQVREALTRYVRAVKCENEFMVNKAIGNGSDPADTPE
jgi:hypothetical protein